MVLKGHVISLVAGGRASAQTSRWLS